LIAFVDSNRFYQLDTILEQLLFGRFKRKIAIDLELPKHYAYVPRIIVTPTQDYLVQPELVAENRVIRQYGHEYAMRIAFREEDFSKLTSFADSLKDVLETRVVKLLNDGIRLCGRHFQFLACSNSQLRDHGAWLYANDGKVVAEDIRQSLGELDGIRCVATYVSRMGQCFSSTKESVKVSIAKGVEITEIEEIQKDYQDEFFECCGNFISGTYVFSDGIGKISQALAKNVRAKETPLARPHINSLIS
jgi:RNA-dependent RNA polymerase